MATVKMYTSAYCPYCSRAKALLQRQAGLAEFRVARVHRLDLDRNVVLEHGAVGHVQVDVEIRVVLADQADPNRLGGSIHLGDELLPGREVNRRVEVVVVN